MERLVRFARDERGSQSIGFVLWVPIFVAVLVIVVDATTLYITQTEMENVARNTVRRVVTGTLETHEEAEAYAASAMGLRPYPYTVVARYNAVTGAEVIIAVQSQDASILGYISPLTITGTTIGARVVMRPEPLRNYDDFN